MRGCVRAAAVPAVIGLAALAGCLAVGAVHVEHAQTGEIVVRAGAPSSFERVADSVYGDSTLARSVALVAHLPYEDGLPRGTVLVLPIRERLESRLRTEEASERHFEMGLAAADGGSFRTAADHFREALRQAPNRMDVRYNLGLALMQAGQLSEATDILAAVAEARPGDAKSRYAFGTLLRRRGAHVRAYEEFDAALRDDPAHGKAAFARAKTLEDLGRWTHAERAWRDFLRDFPDDPLAENARRSLAGLAAKRAEREASGSETPPGS